MRSTTWTKRSAFFSHFGGGKRGSMRFSHQLWVVWGWQTWEAGVVGCAAGKCPYPKVVKNEIKYIEKLVEAGF